VGSAVAEAFVRGLAEATGGACEFVAPREDMAERVHRHFQRMYAPRARSAFVRWPAQALCRVPDAIGPVYGGDTVHLFAWFAEKPEGRVSLEVTLADGRVVRHETEIHPFEGGPVEMPATDDGSLPALTRLAAARRLAATGDGKAATVLAVRYQLMSKWTNYIVVHVRADTQKAEDLPKIIRVAQVLAAGWHGMGTAHMKQCFLLDVCDDLAAPAMAERAADLRSMRSRPYAWPMRGVAAGAIGPTEWVALLNAQAMSSSPSLNDLEVWGAPEAVLVVLRDLVDQGVDEAMVVTAFLYLVAGSEAGNALDRQVRRRILKAYKTATPRQAVMDAVTCAFDGWQSQGTAEDIGR
jgi:Ca-activated chloride channel family protein